MRDVAFNLSTDDASLACAGTQTRFVLSSKWLIMSFGLSLSFLTKRIKKITQVEDCTYAIKHNSSLGISLLEVYTVHHDNNWD